MATVSTQYIKDILKTLPVGYYLGSRAEVTFSETAPTSVCNPLTGQIIVSANNVKSALLKLSDDKDTEEFVRDALYHEVSHLILTPKVPSYNITNYLNIFEDERIECLLSKFYKKVNFKRFCFEMNHWDPDVEIKDEIQFFFNIVRFRNGPKQFVDRVPELITKWHELNCMTAEYDTASDWFKKTYGDDGYYGRNSFGHYSYVRDVRDFFEEVKEYWNTMTDEQKNMAGKSSPDSQKNSQEGQNMPGAGKDDEEKKESNQPQNTPGESSDDNKDNGENEQKEVVDGKNVKDPNMKDGDGSVNTENDQTENSENDSDGDGENGKSSEDPDVHEDNDKMDDGFSSDDAVGGSDQTSPFDQAVEDAEKQAEKNAIDSEILDPMVKEIINKALNVYSDPAICSTVRRIMIRACKKRSNKSAVENRYSGKIDPMSVGIRKDYRWFQKKGENGSNKFDRVHLVLWVDKSGSFYKAMPKINCMIKSLHDVEKTMPYDFSFDVVAMDTNNELHDKTQPMQANGGNFFGPGVEELSRKLNRPGWSNYNVVVWDGDLGSDRRRQDYICGNVTEYLRKYRRAFNVFNNQHSIIVSDKSNERYLKRPCRNARMKLLYRDYAETFINTVIELLDHML